MDLQRDLHEVASAARLQAHARNVMPLEAVLGIVTLNGARAMGIDE
jgi:hypothetical protein